MPDPRQHLIEQLKDDSCVHEADARLILEAADWLRRSQVGSELLVVYSASPIPVRFPGPELPASRHHGAARLQPGGRSGGYRDDVPDIVLNPVEVHAGTHGLALSLGQALQHHADRDLPYTVTSEARAWTARAIIGRDLGLRSVGWGGDVHGEPHGVEKTLSLLIHNAVYAHLPEE